MGNVTECALTLSRLDDFSDIIILIYCNDNNIFGGEAGHFFWGGGSFRPSKSLDIALIKNSS